MIGTTTGVGGRVGEHGHAWPELELSSWQATHDTLHLWTQIIGKVRLALSPKTNHWWNVPLYVGARRLTTSPMPYGDRTLEIELDFIDHQVVLETSDGERRYLPLEPRSVASFYRELMSALQSLGMQVHIWPVPVEMTERTPFDHDTIHAAYARDYAHRFFQALHSADAVLKEFSGRFIGKQSPVHFFWGSFDLASTRFSGRPAPERPGADLITREAYSHEVMSFGWWPGTQGICDAAFYAYAAPEPEGFKSASVRPDAAAYHPQLSEFILPYDIVRRSPSPREMLLEFFQSVYEAGADLGRWDRAACDLKPVRGEPSEPAHPPVS